MFDNIAVLGSHATEHEVDYIKMLENKGVKFLDPKITIL